MAEEYPLDEITRLRRTTKRPLRLVRGWWVAESPKPAPKAQEISLKGHHECPCGSGKKYRNCCQP